jgi:DNA-binding response OmpR family regulator
VEDQKDVHQLLDIALQSPELRILHAFDAEQGLQLARSEKPDLILLDIMMPGGMDGMDLLRTLRSESAALSPRVVMMSARTRQNDIAAAYAAGADGYLAKPFRLVELKKTIDQMLSPGVTAAG